MSRALYDRSKGNCAWLISAWQDKVLMLRSEWEMDFSFWYASQEGIQTRLG